MTNNAYALVLALKVACGDVGVTRQVRAKAPEQTEVRRLVAYADGRQKTRDFRGWAMEHLVEIVADVTALTGQGEAFQVVAPRCVVEADALGGVGEEFHVEHEGTNHEARAALARFAVHGNNVLGAL